MAKINGRYEQPYTEKLLANIENDDIDLTMVIEQLWDDLQLAYNQIGDTTNRSDEYAEFHHLN